MVAYIETAILLFLLFEIVVVNLYCKYNAAAKTGDGVGDEHRPYNVRAVQQPLYHKGKRSHTHHQECWQCNAVGVTGAYGFYDLRQKA